MQKHRIEIERFIIKNNLTFSKPGNGFCASMSRLVSALDLWIKRDVTSSIDKEEQDHKFSTSGYHI